jgi:thiamine biosynthesis lipoprotein
LSDVEMKRSPFVALVMALAASGSVRSLGRETPTPAQEAARPEVARETGDMSREFRYIMGNSVEVRAYNGDAAARAAAIDEAFAAIAEVDRVMSNWKADSEVTGANRGAAAGPVRLSDPLFAVIKAGLEVADRSGGAFDLTVGPAVQLWGFRTRTPHVPTDAELIALRGLVNYRNIVLDERERTMRFARAGVEVDLGGIAKGFAVELAAGALRARGLSGYIDAGGNQFLLGRPPGKQAWTVGVRDPDHPGDVLGTLDLPEGSVSTSAENANFLTVNGRQYGHILDPRTLRPAESGALSVTLFSPDATIADAVSTGALVLGPERGLALIDSFPGMMGLITFHKADGSIGIVTSARLRPLFHPVAKSSRR